VLGELVGVPGGLRGPLEPVPRFLLRMQTHPATQAPLRWELAPTGGVIRAHQPHTTGPGEHGPPGRVARATGPGEHGPPGRVSALG
jgi:hypothetical protein